MNKSYLYLCRHPNVEPNIGEEIQGLKRRNVAPIISVGKIYVGLNGQPSVKANLDIRMVTDLLTRFSEIDRDIYIFTGDNDFIYPVEIYNYVNKNLCRFLYWPLHCSKDISTGKTYYNREYIPLLCPYDKLDTLTKYSKHYCVLIDGNNILGRINNNYKELVNIIHHSLDKLDLIYQPE